MHRTMAVVLFGLSLLIQSHAVSADATPYPAQILGWCLNYTFPGSGFSFGCGFTSPAQACTAAAGSYVFDHFDMMQGYGGGWCWYSDPLSPGAPLVTNFMKWSRNSYCYKGGLEDDSSAAAPICSCRYFPPGYVYPPGGPGPGLPICVPGVPDTCPVDGLPDFPPTGDLCSASLEAGRGRDVNNACSASSVMNDPKGEPCLAQKLGVLGIPYTGPTATIRTAAYQAHLGEVFDKFWQHQWLITDPVTYEQCTAKRKVVEGEMSKHEIDYAPAPSDSKHLDGRAFDVSRNLAKTLEQTLRQTGRSVSRFLAAPPACNLGWGGTWPSPDKVHFYTP